MTTNHTTPTMRNPRTLIAIDPWLNGDPCADCKRCEKVCLKLADRIDQAIAGAVEHRENELTRLRAEIAELRAEREAMAKQEPVGVTYAKYVCGDGDTVAIHWLLEVKDRPPPGTHVYLSSPVPIPEGHLGAESDDETARRSAAGCEA